jgi:hypothetical protein
MLANYREERERGLSQKGLGLPKKDISRLMRGDRIRRTGPGLRIVASSWCEASAVSAGRTMYSYQAYDKLYNPFRRDGVKASTRQLGKGNLVVAEIVGAANYGITAPVTIADAINVQLSLPACTRSDLFIDGRHSMVLIEAHAPCRSTIYVAPPLLISEIPFTSCTSTYLGAFWMHCRLKSLSRRLMTCGFSQTRVAAMIPPLNILSSLLFQRFRSLTR